MPFIGLSSAERRSLAAQRLLRDLDQRRGLRPLGLHVAAVMGRAHVRRAIVEDTVLAAMASELAAGWRP